jgi:alpha-glucosidase
MIRMRLAHPALTEGGMRWLHASDDVLVYVREHAEGSVLVAAARAGFQVELPDGAVHGTGTALVGDATFDGTTLRGAGPSFTAWALPATQLPAFGSA